MNGRRVVLSARLSHPKVIGRDHIAPEELYVKDGRDEFASHFAAQQRLLTQMQNLPSKWGRMTSTTSKVATVPL